MIGEVRKLRRFENTGSLSTTSAGKQFRQDVLRHRGEIIVRRLHRAVFPFHSFDAAIRNEKSSHPGAQLNFPALPGKRLAAAFVQLAERNTRNADAIAAARGKKRFPEHVDSVARVDAIQFFIERADQNDFPEAANRALGLAMLLQPREHRDVFTRDAR